MRIPAVDEEVGGGAEAEHQVVQADEAEEPGGRDEQAPTPEEEEEGEEEEEEKDQEGEEQEGEGEEEEEEEEDPGGGIHRLPHLI